MRLNRNPQDSISRGAARKLGMTQRSVEWLDSGSWRLPSGKALAEFALQAGFLAPLLFQSGRLGIGAATAGNAGSVKAPRMSSAMTHFGEGSGR